MISVIVPVYNSEKTIEKCVDSILMQKVELQILLVNDGSHDRSIEILHRYAQNHANVVVVDKPNGGVSSARNAGIAASSGEYVTFIDSDDYYLTDDYLLNLLNAIQREPDVDLAVAGYTLLRQDGSKPIPSVDEIIDAATVAEHFLEYKERNLLNSPCNKLFRRAWIRTNFDERMKMGEDAVFVLAYMENCRKIAFCSGCGYGYVFMNTSTTADFRKNKGYDIVQTNIYHNAICSFLKSHLEEQDVAPIYIKLRTNAVCAIATTILRKNGLFHRFKENIAELFSDPQFYAFSDYITALPKTYEHRKLARLIQQSRAASIKRYCIWYLIKSKIPGF